MTTEADALVHRYLDDLDHELRDVPAGRRRELVVGGGLWLGSAEIGVLLLVFLVTPVVAIVYLGLRLRD